MRYLLLLAAVAACAQEGPAEEKRACIACHSLRLIHSQRLPRAVWDRELTKMTGWGTEIKNREALLDYLATEYSDAKPAPKPVMTLAPGK